MKSRMMWFILSFLMALSLVLASCTTTTEEEEEEEGVIVEEEEEEEEEEEGGPPVGGNWWDKWGEPEYGGTIIYRDDTLTPNFDNYSWFFAEYDFWWELPWVRVDMTLDRDLWSFTTDFTPEEYCTGLLAESWEQPDLQTIIVHLRQGVHFQDKPPVNGRELTAYDVQQHYDRILGTGSGYTEPAPMYASFIQNWESVTATDKYTFVYKFKEPSAFNFLSAAEPLAHQSIEAPEWVEQGDLQNWRNAVGTGPWILTDYVSGTSMTFSRNPDYWGYDERYPQNQLPYADTFKILDIGDMSTAMAALRTGKIDVLDLLNWRQAQSLAKTNPELQQQSIPASASGVQFRCDKEPFTDINVRKALQMSIDREAMAKTLFGGTVDGKPCSMVNPALQGYYFDYEDWPQELKDEYSYNPERARELLAEAGYPNGFKTNCVVNIGSNLEIYEAIKSYFLEVDVDMELRMMDWAQYGSFLTAGKHDQMSAQGGAATWPPNRTIQTYDSRSPENSAFNDDPGYDALVDEFWAVTSSAEVAEITREIDRYTIDKHWAVITFPTFNYTMWQPYLKGYSGEVHTGWGGAYSWARLWVDQDMKKSMGR